MGYNIYRVGNYTIIDDKESKELHEVPTKLISIERLKGDVYEIKEDSDTLFRGHVSNLFNDRDVVYTASTFNSFRNV